MVKTSNSQFDAGKPKTFGFIGIQEGILVILAATLGFNLKICEVSPLQHLYLL